MANVIESTTSQTTYTGVTDVGSTGEFDVTKPTGLTVGDLMVLVVGLDTGTLSTLSGWTSESISSNSNQPQYVHYKVADAGDVAASEFTWTTSNDSANYIYFCYRLTGGRTTATPFIQKLGQTEDQLTTDPVTVSVDPAMNIPSGTLLLFLIGTDYGLNTNVDPVSNYSITGATASFTERLNDAEVTDEYTVLADTITTTGGLLTDASFDTAAAPGSSTVTWNVNVLAIFPVQNADTTPTFTTTEDGTAFAPAGSAGANASPAITETSNTTFAPTGRGDSMTSWTNENVDGTAWVNDTVK